jgi:hypothetical protein
MSTFSLIGTSIEFFLIGVAQLTSPTPLVGASCTGSPWILALALAIASAWRVALATESVLSELVAAKPQVPLAITRNADAGRLRVHHVLDLVLARDHELAEIPPDAHVAVAAAAFLGRLQRGVGELLLELEVELAAAGGKLLGRDESAVERQQQRAEPEYRCI